jgi:hypothetical protein
MSKLGLGLIDVGGVDRDARLEKRRGRRSPETPDAESLV